MFRKRRAPSMEELRALEEMDQKSKPIRRNELIDESEPQPSQIAEEEEMEETEPEERRKDCKTGKLLRSRFLISIQVGACLIILVAFCFTFFNRTVGRLDNIFQGNAV